MIISSVSPTPVCLSHTRACRGNLSGQQLGTYDTMLDVRFELRAADARSICGVDADIVEEGSLSDEREIQLPLRMVRRYLESSSPLVHCNEYAIRARAGS